MTEPVEIVRLSEDQFAEAAAMRMRAFFDDPMFVWILPDVASRERKMLVFFQVTSRVDNQFGEV